MIPFPFNAGGLGLIFPPVAGGGATYSGWNGGALANVVYSNSNRTATFTAGVSGTRVLRSAIAKSAGQFYFEVQAQQTSGGSLGIGFASGATGTFLGGNAAGWAYWDYLAASPPARTYHNNVSTSQTAATPNMGAGTRIGIAIDFAAGKGWVSRNGTFIGNPAAGTGNSFTFTPGTTLYPATDIFVQLSACTYYANPADHTYSAPSGFTAGWPD